VLKIERIYKLVEWRILNKVELLGMRELRVGYLGPIRRKYFEENVVENTYLQSRDRTVTKTLKEIVTGNCFYDTCQGNTNAEIKTKILSCLSACNAY